VNPYDAPVADSDDSLTPKRTGWANIRTTCNCLTLIAMAAALHLIIREYYPSNIDRSKWLVAFALLAVRNGFIGASIGSLVHHGWLGLVTGIFVPPIVMLAVYGVPC
jgi:hypothetical protein